MASILEPYRGKRTPNETGTISVYASVNRRRGYDDNDISGLERHFYTKQQVDTLIDNVKPVLTTQDIPDSTWTKPLNSSTNMLYEILLEPDTIYRINFLFRRIDILSIDGIAYDPNDTTQYGSRDILSDMQWRISVYINNTWFRDINPAVIAEKKNGIVRMTGDILYQTGSLAETANFKISFKYDGTYTGPDKTIEFAIRAQSGQPNLIQILKI